MALPLKVFLAHLHLVIRALSGHQLGMIALFDNGSLRHNKDDIRILDS